VELFLWLKELKLKEIYLSRYAEQKTVNILLDQAKSMVIHI
jgi:hypothetical protein